MRLLALIAAAIALFLPLEARAGNVGFIELNIANGADKPLNIGVWYPTDAPASAQAFREFTQTVAPAGPAVGSGLPLVVFSHGTGGWYGEHYDTALALAHAGFVVAAVSHTGDTYDDHSRAASVIGRPPQVRRLIDYMLSEWPEHGRIDANRVGVFGFSSGGFTALVAAGGTPNFSTIGPHCAAHPGYFDCQVLVHAHIAASSVPNAPASAWIHDPRIKAAVIAAPALGFTFGPEGLKGVTIPVQLWRDEKDHILPNPDYAEAVRMNLPTPPEFHLVVGADHDDFLAPCSDVLRKAAPEICVSPPGFDRIAFHETFDREVVRFFEKILR
jgi:predicted dienelactone hydrolase